MNAWIKFDLDDPFDKVAHLRCTEALNMGSVLWEFDQWLRGEYKYGDKEYCEEIREEFHRFMNDNDINLDELII